MTRKADPLNYLMSSARFLTKFLIVNKTEIAAVLTDIATLLELKGENPFKTRAYQAGARVVESLGEAELAQRIEAGTLDDQGKPEEAATAATPSSVSGTLSTGVVTSASCNE